MSGKARYLMVPMHLDALCLNEAQAVLREHADFSRLPWFDGERDRNAGTPYLSEEILSQPFADRNLLLKPGIHLHWALPDTLSRSLPFAWVSRQPFLNLFGVAQGLAIWQALLEQQWLQPIVSNTVNIEAARLHSARIQPASARRGELGSEFAIFRQQIEGLLHQQMFPAVPNRWLVTRQLAGSAAVQWLVESDYLHPPDADASSGAITFPAMGIQNGQTPPFRYLGRKTLLSRWQPAPTDSYLPEPLTALGYGDPSFAAFYPNCHSVFGCYEEQAGELTDLHYTVMGWHDDPAQDLLQQYIREFRLHQNGDAAQQNLRLLEGISRDLQWQIPITVNQDAWADTTVWEQLLNKGWLQETAPGSAQAFINPTHSGTYNPLAAEFQTRQAGIENQLGEIIAAQLPQALLCYAELRFAPETTVTALPDNTVSLAVGNTSPEALSAHLAQQLSTAHTTDVEEQLDILQLLPQLDNRQLDLHAKFDEARHQRGFQAVSGGTLWSVQLHAEPEQAADAHKAQARAELHLDETTAHLLNEANRLQHAYDQALFAMADQRKQVFADWYKYLQCAYPQEGYFHEYVDDHPQADEVRYFLQQQTLALLEKQVRAAGQLGFTQPAAVLSNPLDNTIDTVAADLSNTPGSLASQLATALNNLWRALRRHNQQEAVQQSSGRYELEQTAAPYYWEPQEPALLISGEAVKPSQRHGQDGRLHPDGLLQCSLVALDATQPIPAQQASLLQAIKALRQGEGEQIGHCLWTSQPWNPYLLEWEVEFLPAVLPLTENQQDDASERFSLPDNAVETELGDTRQSLTGAYPYRGSSLLSAHVAGYLSKLLVKQLIALLRPGLLRAYFVQLTPAAAEQTPAYLLNDPEPFNRWLQGWGQRGLSVPDALQANTTQPIHEQFDGWMERNLTALINWQFADSAFLGELADELGVAAIQPGAEHLQVVIPQLHALAESLRAELLRHLSIPGEALAPEATAALRDKLAQVRSHLQFLVLAEAYASLSRQDYLAQILSGFNQALLMHKQTLQLEIADPLGFGDYQPFTQRVREAVLGANIGAPQPLQHFLPVRAGAMNLLNLRLVDTFGQALDLRWDGIQTTSQMAGQLPNEPIHCPPRISLPARLNFRWLSADFDDMEMNEHPAASPICGWLLPNNLDDSLLIHAADGTGLGQITQHRSQPWQAIPGSQIQTPVDAIPNRHLRQMVQAIIRLQMADVALDADPPFLSRLRNALENGLEHIEPESFAQHEALALLVGRPIALVRASVSLELRGMPAVDQSWHAFSRDLQRHSRETAGFEELEFPVRIGEFSQLNDGLLGYWIEDGAGYAHDLFYAPQSEPEQVGVDPAADHIITHRSGVGDGLVAERHLHFHRWLSVAAEPLQLAMLIDPRGSVHATSGLLPTKSIDIPPAQYLQALQKMEVSFLTAPLLMPAGELSLSLPDEPGHSWTWLSRDANGWVETEQEHFSEFTSEARFRQAGHELREGWLKLHNTPETEEE